MIGRVTLLLKDKKISKQEFDKYIYIITKLNNHLIDLIDELYLIETNRNEPDFEFDIKNPNMELVSFGFLIEVSSQLYPGATQISQYKKTDYFDYFYKRVFKDET